MNKANQLSYDQISDPSYQNLKKARLTRRRVTSTISKKVETSDEIESERTLRESRKKKRSAISIK